MEQLFWQRQSDAGSRHVHARLVTHAPSEGWSLHTHDYIECFCVDEGTLQHQWQGEWMELVPGDVVALLPGEAHQGIAGSAGMRIINISCAAQALPWLRRRTAGVTTPWDGDRQQRLRVIGVDQRAMLRSVVAVVDYAQSMSRDLVLLALVQALAIHGSVSTLPLWLDRVLRDHIDAGDAGGVRELAKRAGISREHLAREVRRRVGSSVTELLRHRRLQQAANRLRVTDASLAAIAQAVGFRSMSAFYAGFQAYYQTSPAAYRRHTHFVKS